MKLYKKIEKDIIKLLVFINKYEFFFQGFICHINYLLYFFANTTLYLITLHAVGNVYIFLKR